MGSCSNRSENRNERISRFASEISRATDINECSWQIKHGSEIRGELGIEKGNQFIKTIRGISG